MSERDALIAACLTNLREDTPRLILADCLDEHDQDSGRLRDPGRWEWTTDGWGPWRLYWHAIPAGNRDPYTFVAIHDPPLCQHLDCLSQHLSGLSYDGLIVCWSCATKMARRKWSTVPPVPPNAPYSSLSIGSIDIAPGCESP